MAQLQNSSANFIPVNNINLHYIDYHSDGPILILLHGLTANAHAFDAVVEGLQTKYRVICPDLRGNGLSDKPAFCYTIEDHAEDIIGLINHLGVDKVHLGGHSFGGFLSFYLAANYPDAIDKLVILDAAKAMNSNAANMLAGALGRLNATYPSFEEYLEHVKKAPYINFWDTAMVSYYRADVEDLPNGHVKPRCNIMSITEKSVNLASVDWPCVIDQVEHPTLLINALDNYTLGEPLLPEEIAKETVEMMKNARYEGIDGNHQTMLYGEGAQEIIGHLHDFLGDTHK